MKPIKNFTDHPQLKHEPVEYLYESKNGFYWATPNFFKAAQIVLLTDTNMGDPFRQLARIKLILDPSFTESSMDISMADAVQLVKYCERTGYEIAVSSSLKENSIYQSYLEKD